MKQTCKICGKTFETKQRNHNICSEDCRKVNRTNAWKKWRIENKERRNVLVKNSKSYKARLKPHFCSICGKPTVWNDRIHQFKHDECVIQQIIESINAGNRMTGKQYQQLQARGYDIRSFCDEYADVLSQKYLISKSRYINKANKQL